MTTHSLRGPNVAAIGWVPRFDDPLDLPAGHNYETNTAMRFVFNSGNPTPNMNFSGFDEFDNWLDTTQEYRAALYIRNVVLRYGDEDPTPKIDYNAEAIVGFTPPRVMIAGMDLTPWPIRHQYFRGAGSNMEEPEDGPLPGNSGMWIKHKVFFKLSWWIDTIGRALTGHWAPSAPMDIHYRIYKDGSVDVDFLGSAIPSQAYYVRR